MPRLAAVLSATSAIVTTLAPASLAAQHVVEGRVVSAADGMPVEDASVRVAGEDFAAEGSVEALKRAVFISWFRITEPWFITGILEPDGRPWAGCCAVPVAARASGAWFASCSRSRNPVGHATLYSPAS